MPKQIRTAKRTADSGFRLIRALSIDHNAQRLRKHVQRLERLPRQVRWAKKWKTRLDRRKPRQAGHFGANA